MRPGGDSIHSTHLICLSPTFRVQPWIYGYTCDSNYGEDMSIIPYEIHVQLTLYSTVNFSCITLGSRVVEMNWLFLFFLLFSFLLFGFSFF